jgi:hypothetical protein
MWTLAPWPSCYYGRLLTTLTTDKKSGSCPIVAIPIIRLKIFWFHFHGNTKGGEFWNFYLFFHQISWNFRDMTTILIWWGSFRTESFMNFCSVVILFLLRLSLYFIIWLVTMTTVAILIITRIKCRSRYECPQVEMNIFSSVNYVTFRKLTPTIALTWSLTSYY